MIEETIITILKETIEVNYVLQIQMCVFGLT